MSSVRSRLAAAVVATASLGAALVVAKLALVALRALDGLAGGLASPWTPAALLHEDVLLLAAFGLLHLALGAGRMPWGAWALYATCLAWTALNVPVARIFSTPLTHAMVGTVGGALRDSILEEATPGNVAAVAAVVAAGVLAPRWLRRVDARRLGWGLAAAGVALLVAGPLARGRVRTLGVHRNAVWTLARTTWRAELAPAPSTGGEATSEGEEELPSLPPAGEATDLTHLRGAGEGLDVVVVVLESTGARHLKPWGAERNTMPNLGRLLSDAVLFDRIYTPYPESIKGTHAHLCSGYPAAHTEPADYAADALPGPCMGTLFRRAGYRTGLFHSGRFVYLGMSHVVEDRGFDVLKDASDIGGPHESSFGTADASTVEAILDFLDASGGEPTLTVYMPIAGHHPYDAPGDGPRPFERDAPKDAYHNDLHMGDAALGTLIEGVRERGRMDETVWVVFGDHGQAFQEHPGNFAHSLFLYEENVHVPMALVLPEGLRGRIRAPQAGTLVDVLPTLLDVMGMERGPAHQGRSLLEPVPGVAPFFTDHRVWQMGLRHGRWKQILDVEADSSRLFDLRADPGETEDVSASHPDRVARYERYLRAWHARNDRRVTGEAAP